MKATRRLLKTSTAKPHHVKKYKRLHSPSTVTTAPMITCQLFNQGGHQGYKTERMGGYSYTMDDGNYSMIVRRILGKYTRVFARP